jgi:chromosome segregation ATPase
MMRKLLGSKLFLGLLIFIAIFGLTGYLFFQNSALRLENEKLNKEIEQLKQNVSQTIRDNSSKIFKYGYSEFSTIDECEEEVNRLKQELSQVEREKWFESSQSLNSDIDLSQCEREKRRLEDQVNNLENEVSRLQSQLR